MPLNERIGLDGLSADQKIWRFLNRQKVVDLTTKNSLRLSRIFDLRKIDEREGRLPSVLGEVFEQVAHSEAARRFIRDMLGACENQALNVFCSCWFLPGTSEQEQKMWKQFGGREEGGARINSTIQRLISSLPTDAQHFFGIGRVQYIRRDIELPRDYRAGSIQIDAVSLETRRSHRRTRDSLVRAVSSS